MASAGKQSTRTNQLAFQASHTALLKQQPASRTPVHQPNSEVFQQTARLTQRDGLRPAATRIFDGSLLIAASPTLCALWYLVIPKCVPCCPDRNRQRPADLDTMLSHHTQQRKVEAILVGRLQTEVVLKDAHAPGVNMGPIIIGRRYYAAPRFSEGSTRADGAGFGPRPGPAAALHSERGPFDARSDLDHRLGRRNPRLHGVRHAVWPRRCGPIASADVRGTRRIGRWADLDIHLARRFDVP
jgi:hypothetical protein